MSWDFASMLEGTKDDESTDWFGLIVDPFQQYVSDPFKEQFFPETTDTEAKPTSDPFAAFKEKLTTFTAPFEMFSDPLAGLQDVFVDPFSAISEAIGDPFAAMQQQLAAGQQGVADWGAGVQDYFANMQKGMGDWFGGIGQGMGEWFSGIQNMLGGGLAGIGGFFGKIVQWLGKYWWVIVIIIVAAILLYFSPVLIPMITGAGKAGKVASLAGKGLGIAEKLLG